MAAAGALGVVHVDDATADRAQRVLDETRFVQRVGVQLHLEVVVVGHAEAGVDRRRHRAPVLVDLEAEAAGPQLLDERRRLVRVAAPEEAEVHRPRLGGLQHLAGVEGAAAVDADRNRPERAAEHGGDARRDGVLDEAGRVEMHVHVDRARRDDHALAIAHRRARADDQAWIDAIHDGRIAGLADADDPAILHADVALDDAQDGIDDERVAEQEVERAIGVGDARGEAEAVAQRLAAAVQAFVAIDCVVGLSTTATSDVSPRRMPSPTVGP